jgi:hypothetical protein
MRTLTLKKSGYIIKGVADLSLWGGGNACIEMATFDVKTLKNNINDNGFGVEKINGAICNVFENYEGTLKFLKTVEIGKISDNTRDNYNNQY